MNQNLTKAELVAAISKQTRVEIPFVAEILESFMENVKKTVAQGDTIQLRGFGTFGNKYRAKKTARNINAEKQIIVPAHNVAYFKPSREFKAKEL